MNRWPTFIVHARAKEIAKFIAGITFGTALAQFALGQAGALPMKVAGVTLTPALNGLLTFLGAALSAHLAYYAWRNDSSSYQGGSDRGDTSFVPRRPPSRSRWVR